MCRLMLILSEACLKKRGIDPDPGISAYFPQLFRIAYQNRSSCVRYKIRKQYNRTMSSQGLVYIFTGDGKGKTSAALGMLVRALASDWEVGWISWYKEASWGISEHKLHEILQEKTKNNLTFLPMGKGFYLQNAESSEGVKKVRAHHATITDNDTPDEHRLAAEEALNKARELLPQVQLLILDEICNAVRDGLLQEEAVVELLRHRGKTHVVLTGREAAPVLVEEADLVTEMKKIKHPFDQGKLAIKGLDF